MISSQTKIAGVEFWSINTGERTRVLETIDVSLARRRESSGPDNGPDNERRKIYWPHLCENSAFNLK